MMQFFFPGVHQMLERIAICRFMVINNSLHTRLGVKKIYFTNKSYYLWELISLPFIILI